MAKPESHIPNLRFAGFTDSWKYGTLGKASIKLEYGLGAAAKPFDGINKYIRITDIDDNFRVFAQDDLTSPDIDLSNLDDYLLNETDIVFARTGASVGKTYKYKKADGRVYFAGFLIRARITTDFSAEFIFQNTLSEKYNNFVRITSQRSGQPGINATEYADFKFYYPTFEEQAKIGDFFQKIDQVIELQQKALDTERDYKKVMLQKMFPQKGEKVPQVRFDGFSGDWNKKNLKGVAEINPSSNLPKEFYYVDLESVKGSRLIGCRTENKDTAPSRAQRLAIYGDVFYQTVRPYQKNNYLFNSNDDNYVFSTGYAQLRPLMDNDSAFIFAHIQNERFVNDVLERCTGTSYPSINSTDLSLINIYVPKFEEQQKIGAFFQKLDQQIEQNERKLENYQQLKKAMLQRMFV